MKIKVENMTSNNGNKIANQFILKGNDFCIFQSYDSVIVKKVYKKGNTTIYLDERFWDYSCTTGKYRNIFLGETKKDTERKIASGQYKLADLN